MNLPISKPVVENVYLDLIEPNKLLQDLNTKQFTGFTYLTIHSAHNFEECIIFFLKGNVAGSIYINNTYNAELFGKNALDLSFNSLSYSDGLLNIYQLSEEQLKLVLIFNDKIKHSFNLDAKSLSKINFTYKEELFKNILKDKIVEVYPRSQLFDKFNITELLRL